ncbi:hypothetical protein BHM03_00055911 [Ensete ventricosum]|nr:hypothetical protein BHM03_00055911 [Ensete ventricosum]
MESSSKDRYVHPKELPRLYDNLVSRTKRPVLLSELDEIHRQMVQIERDAIQQAQDAIHQLDIIMEKRFLYYQKNNTKDNYWGDWLPLSKEAAVLAHEATSTFGAFITKLKKFCP